MAGIKKHFTFSGKGNIWRLIPDDRNHLLIETRDTEKKQVYYDYIDLVTGKTLLKNFQLEEKFWVGVEKVCNGTVYFHRFAKPDMPGHRGIIAFDIENEKILWEQEELVFSFMLDEKIFAFIYGFEKNTNYELDLLTGEITNEIPGEEEFKSLYEKAMGKEDYSEYIFPERYFPGQPTGKSIEDQLNKVTEENSIEGVIEFASVDSLLVYNYHTKNSDGTYNNNLKIVELENNKSLLEEVINKKTGSLIPDCFFIKKEFLFLLKEMKKVFVYKLVN